MTAATNRSRRARFRREVVLAVGARPTRRRAFRGTFGGRAVAPARLIHSSPHLHSHTPTPARRAREEIANERKLSRGNTAPGSPDPASRARAVRRSVQGNNTALGIAATFGHVAVVRLLIAAGAQVDLADEVRAVIDGDVSTVEQGAGDGGAGGGGHPSARP